MSEQQETIFADGLIFTKKRDGAPDFVLGGVSVKVDDFIAFLTQYKKGDGWVNLDMLKPKEQGKRPYFKLNTWKPEVKEDTATPPEDASSTF